MIIILKSSDRQKKGAPIYVIESYEIPGTLMRIASLIVVYHEKIIYALYDRACGLTGVIRPRVLRDRILKEE